MTVRSAAASLIAGLTAALMMVGCAGPMKLLEFPPPVVLQDLLPGQALVYLMRVPNVPQEVAIAVDGRLAAVVGRGRYTALSLPPGTFQLTAVTRPAWGSFNGQEAAEPLTLTLAAGERKFFYLSDWRQATASMDVIPVGKTVGPIFRSEASSSGLRRWTEASEREVQDLLGISRLSLPEKVAF